MIINYKFVFVIKILRPKHSFKNDIDEKYTFEANYICFLRVHTSFVHYFNGHVSEDVKTHLHK